MNIRRALAALLLAAAVATALAGCGGGDDASASEPSTPTTATTSTVRAAVSLPRAAAAVRAQLSGIPQSGLLLGPQRAPVTIIEYAGFDCAACATAHETLVPALIERYVRPGRASLELRILAAGDHDLAIALGVHAARPQRRAWQMIQLAYDRAGVDPTTPLAAAETPSAYAKALGLDVGRWRRDVDRPRWAADLQAALSVFKVAKWGETPIFLVRRAGLDVPFEVVSAPTSLEELDRAIDAALGR